MIDLGHLSIKVGMKSMCNVSVFRFKQKKRNEDICYGQLHLELLLSKQNKMEGIKYLKDTFLSNRLLYCHNFLNLFSFLTHLIKLH